VKAKKKADPGFYNAYKSARVVVNNRGRGRKQADTLAQSAKKAA
jgi:hypothetical protein